MDRLKQRADFLAVAAGARAHSATLIVQALRRDQEMTDPTQKAAAPQIRVGFTVSKKVGNSVVRNRVRRRLREVVRQSLHASFQAGHDYVLVGRRAALNAPFKRIMEDVSRALHRVHADGKTAKARANPQTGKRQTSQ